MHWWQTMLIGAGASIVCLLFYLKGQADGFTEASVYQKKFYFSTRDSEFLEWLANRLVKVYKENEHTDFVLKLREIATRLKGV